LILITPVILIIFEDRKLNRFIKNILGIALVFLILNCLIDKNENLEREVADYLKENSLQQIDFLEHERIKYYVNYNIHDLLQNDTNQSSSLYELLKIDIIERLDEKFIIKKFPEMKPKFILIKHAQ
jgi:hypothetical protein